MRENEYFLNFKTKQEVLDLCKKAQKSQEGEIIWLFGANHPIVEVEEEFFKNGIEADFTTATAMVSAFLNDRKDFDEKSYADTIFIDTVDYIHQKERTQEMFAFFIRKRYIENKVTIIASKRPPESFEKLLKQISQGVITPVFVEMNF